MEKLLIMTEKIWLPVHTLIPIGPLANFYMQHVHIVIDIRILYS